jgi:HopA1 effector protein family
MSGDDLRAALLSVRVGTPRGLEILGHGHPGVEPAEALYSALHCRVSTAGSPDTGFTNWTGARDFADRLSAANGGVGTWQRGWTGHGVEADGRIVVERHGVRFRVVPEEYRPGAGEGAAAVRIPKEHFELIPGFYLAHGDADDTRDDGHTIRLYWHIAPTGAERLVGLTTLLLNRSGIGFQLKLVSEPLRYDRTDPAVLYLARPDYPRAEPVLRKIHHEMKGWLRSTVSLLVKPMAPGVGLAEDPGDGSSFGEHRCRLLAGILTSQGWSEAGSDSEREALLVAGLAAQGYALDRIHLNPGSSDDFPPFEGGGR